MNKIYIRGNLAMDPEFRDVRVKNELKKVCKVLIISSERNRADNEEKILFVTTLWEKQADRVAHLRKGDGVFVMGRLKEDEWMDKDDNPRKTVVLITESIDALSKPQPRGAHVGTAPSFDEDAPQSKKFRSRGESGGYQDDLPF